MRKKFNRLFCIILMLLLCCVLSLAAFASAPVTVRLQVSTMLSGTRIANEDSFEFVLKSVNTGEESSVTITGEGTAKFDELAFNRVGTYKYTVKQMQGANPECIYDPSVYTVTVSVFMKENGEDFDISVTAYKDGSSVKQDSILFLNTYKASPTVPGGSATDPTTAPTTQPHTDEQHADHTEYVYDPNYAPPEEHIGFDAEQGTTEASDEQVKNPITGDTNNLQTWVILFAVGILFVTAALIILIPKKRNTDETI